MQMVRCARGSSNAICGYECEGRQMVIYDRIGWKRVERRVLMMRRVVCPGGIDHIYCLNDDAAADVSASTLPLKQVAATRRCLIAAGVDTRVDSSARVATNSLRKL
eukprot:GHVU01183265.1.p3 GENE.GHVU01183265.1~~GHVU01183265.1.p3  ORF type:complete len:106 (-),score=4.67 GHVU01183265.1:1716-2033(-)